MRLFLDYILDLINSESLSDLEFDSIPEGLAQEYNQETYDALKEVLLSRDLITNDLQRLKFLFMSKGVSFTSKKAEKPPISNIFIGSSL